MKTKRLYKTKNECYAYDVISNNGLKLVKSNNEKDHLNITEHGLISSPVNSLMQYTTNGKDRWIFNGWACDDNNAMLQNPNYIEIIEVSSIL